MKQVSGGVCAPKGFKAGAAMAGIKKADKYDIAIIYSEVEAAVAGMFTTNKVQAAPVIYSRKVAEQGLARGVVVNSGNANACTGSQGMVDCKSMAGAAAKGLGVSAGQIAVASTGVIGVYLPMEKVLSGIEEAALDLSEEGGNKAAQAIMTTDTFLKEAAVEIQLGGRIVKLGGIAKGSGMIHPDMATMLSFITTDAAIDSKLLRVALQEAVAGSFNMVTVDRDTSTNDSVLLLANGLAGNPPIGVEDGDYVEFKRALTWVCQELAQMIARDGEGATKFLTVEVRGAKNLADARKAARGIAASNLTKAAFYGEDANWGRIICALGYSIEEFDPERVDIYLGDLQVAKAGAGLPFSEDLAAQILSQKDIKVKVELNCGEFAATAWGCDLSHDYVTINGSYRT